jgi:DNA-binding transcriptional MerR regulator
MDYRVEELAQMAELSVDTIRYYQKLGLLEPPAKQGRTAVYGDAHRARLDEIVRLSEDGFTLAQIGRLTEHPDDVLLGALRADDDELLDRRELASRSTIDKELVDLAIDAGLIRSRGTEGEQFGLDAVTMLEAASTILSSGLPLDDLIAIAVEHAGHVENVVDNAIDTFSRHLRAGTDPAVAVSQLVPAVSELVAQHFRHTLVDRASARLQSAETTR